MIIREHKLRKRVVFSLDMVSFRKDFCFQCHKQVLYDIRNPHPLVTLPTEGLATREDAKELLRNFPDDITAYIIGD